jgi:glyoxylase-like metal-dependent hydrolase (beta-lactamase superfamily II)
MSMQTLAMGVSYFDLQFQGTPRVIATAVLHGPEVALIDPGPSSALPVLRRELADAGIAIADLSAILLTHIHLDHAGAAGTLARENPRLRVYVHERGAPHLVDPSKLLASAARLYGDAMERLWGEVASVPAGRIVPLAGGERLEAGGRKLDVAYTPGHASHHVSFFNAESGIAFTGDTAGVRLFPQGYVMPPTPPPDIDLDAWRRSVERISAWGPETLFVTHFGPHAPSAAHLAELVENLDLVGRLAKASLERDEAADDGAREAWFADAIRQAVRDRGPSEQGQSYELAAPFDLNWRGLARYWRKGIRT